MLDEVMEFEGSVRVLAAAKDALGQDQAPVLPVFSHLDYLFIGRAAHHRAVWFAGGVTQSGRSVTGSGPDKTSALMAIAGETAEARLAFDARARRRHGLRGQGAGTYLKHAERHAEYELLERHCVTAWWGAGPAGAPFEVDQNISRARSAFHIADLGDAQVVVALSFDKGGTAFCFGAACRGTLQAAQNSALNELVQAEIGLKIARMNTQGRDVAAMSDAVQVAIGLADNVTQDAFMTSGLVDFSAGYVVPQTLAAPQIAVENLGVFEHVLHVAEARFVDAIDPPPAAMPFAHLAVY